MMDVETNRMTGIPTAGGVKEGTDYESVSKRVNDVIQDIQAGRVIRPQRRELSDALDRASSGDKVNDAIGRSRS